MGRQQPAPTRFRNEWIGKPQRTRYGLEYDGFRRAGIEYRVGDVVRLHADGSRKVAGKSTNFFVARINRLYEDEEEDHCMRVAWFYSPEETRGGRKKADHERELFFSDHVDVNMGETVMGHAEVLSKNAFDAWERSREARGAPVRAATRDRRVQEQRKERDPAKWVLDWQVPEHDERVPVFFCRHKYAARTQQRVPCAWPPKVAPLPPSARSSASRRSAAAAGESSEGSGESSGSEGAPDADSSSSDEARTRRGARGGRRTTAAAAAAAAVGGRSSLRGGRKRIPPARRGGAAAKRGRGGRGGRASAAGIRDAAVDEEGEEGDSEEEEKEEEEEGAEEGSGSESEAEAAEERAQLATAVSRLSLRDRLHRACRLLQLSAVPSELPCREAERAKVRQFLESALSRRGAHSALYLSGMPGTGKTATVKEVVRELRRRVGRHRLPQFQFVEINAMKLAHPYHAYTELWRELTGQHAPPQRAAQLLDHRFGTPGKRRKCVVLLADELDFLVTRKQSVLYNLFDWPTRPHARLVVVGVANTMDLPERLLPRISSRLGMARTVFQPYTVPQIETIARERIGALGAFDPDALQMCARKVASVSGDVRRALMICRRAAELVLRRIEEAGAGAGAGADGGEDGGGAAPRAAGGARVGLQEINEAAAELNASHHLQVMRSGSMPERLLLATLVLQMRASGLDFAALEDLLPRFFTLRRTRGAETEPAPTPTELLELLDRMAAARLVVLEPAPAERYPMVRLNVQAEDVVFALRDDPLGELFAE